LYFLALFLIWQIYGKNIIMIFVIILQHKVNQKLFGMVKDKFGIIWQILFYISN
jgi:predicted 3-demethylubiquinone-9 3-methyltransferase (glyoxalase superfamily)